MTLTTDEMVEIALNRLIYAAELLATRFQRGGEFSATLNIDYPFNESFDHVLNALVQWRYSAISRRTSYQAESVYRNRTLNTRRETY